MKKSIKKTLILLTATSSIALPITLISCTVSAADTTLRSVKKDYDFGLATNPINNLNYVKYRSLDRILPAIVDSYIKQGPTDELRSIIPIDKIVLTSGRADRGDEPDFVKYVEGEKAKEVNGVPINSRRPNRLKGTAQNLGYGTFNGNYYPISDLIGTVGGLVRTSSDDPVQGASIFGFTNPRNASNFRAVTGLLNQGLNTWSNGDIVTANDMIDYIHYILDFNTGSQKLEEITKMSIRGANEFLDAQKEYALKFNKNYSNPFGNRRFIKAPWDPSIYISDPDQKVWQSQTKNAKGEPIDLKEVEKIKKAALNIGYYTGQLFLDFSNEEIAKNISLPENKAFSLSSEVQTFYIQRGDKKIKVNLLKNPYANPLQTFDPVTLKGEYKTLSDDKYSFTIIFDQNATHGLSSLLFSVLPKLFIINRKYVETEGGGIQTYGSDPKKFLTSSAFNIANINLGPQGSIDLVRNDSYYTASRTLSKKIKIFFQTDPTIAATWFEDGIIQQSYVPANRINSFWGNKDFRPLLKKNSGFGTIAFGLNLDFETRGDGPLQDPDLRRALYYAINRQDVLKTVGWDFSFPVNTWTAVGAHKTDDGKSLELFFDEQKTTTENGKQFPLQNFSQLVHLAKNFNFEKTDRTDHVFSEETAQFYIDRYKKNHPQTKSVSLVFLNNSTDEQIKAGIYLTEALKKAFGNYVQLEVRSLPENTYAAFAEEGKFDIIYQNYDRLGGTEVFDYIGAFFRSDEIDSYASRTIGFKTNPVGSFTYANWIAGLYKTVVNENRETVLKPYEDFINSLPDFNKEFEDLKSSQFDPAKRFAFVSKFAKVAADTIAANKEEQGIFKDKKLFSSEFIINLIEYAISPVKNIRVSRENRLYDAYLVEVVGVNEIQKATEETAKRLLIPPKFWKKIVELSFRKIDESLTQYGSRISGFFSGTFSDEDLKENWIKDNIYELIAYFEKVIRETVPVIPLAEVDTNWEITKIGGISSLFTYSLQYAYDFTNPPRPGLPRNNNG